MPTDPMTDRRRDRPHRALTAEMGDVVSRSYVRRPACVRQGSSFAAAAVLAAFGPDDWQVSQDVADATTLLLARCLAETTSDTTEVCIELRLHHPIELEVRTDSGWSATVAVHRHLPQR